MKTLYHTDFQPKDRNGAGLRPLDIVLIHRVPEHYWATDTPELKLFEGCYGLITYEREIGSVFRPRQYANAALPGWVSEESSVVQIVSRRLTENALASWDFWIPSSDVSRLPFNSIIMNIFSDYPWQMLNDEGPGDYLFMSEGIPEFEYLREIMQTPLHVLESAHQAAMNVLKLRF